MIAQIEQPALWIAIGGLGITWALLIWSWFARKREMADIRSALQTTGDRPIDQLLVEHFQEKKSLEAKVDDLQRRMADSEAWMDKAIAYASIVRYDAFDNVTGNQSFAIAFQNSKGDGILLNAVSGREQARIYGKSVEGGNCDNGFTPEEKQAIVRALTRAKG
ncbi:MAG: DUF4446 family protein [Fimbriimonadales bacterium]